MPSYEYKCEQCGNKFEKFQSMSDDPLKECPSCNGAVRRLIGTGAGILFKGSGFYETDYKRKKPSISEGAESSCKKAETTTSC